MKKILLLLSAFALILTSSCEKTDNLTKSEDAVIINLQGIVTNQFTGKVMPKVEVSIIKDGTISKTTTDNNGIYKFNGIVAGDVVIKAEKAGFLTQISKMNLLSSQKELGDLKYTESHSENIKMDTLSATLSTNVIIKGRDIDIAAANVPVRIYIEQHGIYVIDTTITTNAVGKLEFKGLPNSTSINATVNYSDSEYSTNGVQEIISNKTANSVSGIISININPINDALIMVSSSLVSASGKKKEDINLGNEFTITFNKQIDTTGWWARDFLLGGYRDYGHFTLDSASNGFNSKKVLIRVTTKDFKTFTFSTKYVGKDVAYSLNIPYLQDINKEYSKTGFLIDFKTKK